jgi:hypothetical protein
VLIVAEEYLTKSPNSSRIGKAVEYLVAASCILASDAELNVSTALVDDEGVDLVFHRRDSSAAIAAQVKSRGSNTTQAAKNRFSAFVRRQTFRVRPDFYLLFVVVDFASAQFGPVWLVPSSDFERLAPLTGRGLYRFNASTGAVTNDRWSEYRLVGEDVPRQLSARLLDHLAHRGGAKH